MTRGADHVRAEAAASGDGATAVRAAGTQPGARRWLENRAVDGWLPRLDLAEVWASREIAVMLALRNITIDRKSVV